MNVPAAWHEVCICGRTFSVPQAYTCHKRTCQKTKKRLASALDKAREVWEARKRKRTEKKVTEAGPSQLVPKLLVLTSNSGVPHAQAINQMVRFIA